MQEISFYFDFLSPYAYLARFELVKIAQRHNCAINYKPIDLKRAKRESGNDGPPTIAIPFKLAFAMQDFSRWSKRYDVPFNSVGGHNGRALNIGALYANRHGKVEQYVELAFHQCWGIGGQPDDPAFLARLVDKLGWRAEDFTAFVSSDEAAEAYESVFQQARNDRVFGVPTMVVGTELWWGNDRLFMLEEYLLEKNRAGVTATS